MDMTYTKKQMGDAGEMLVAAELTLHNVPAFIVPSNWPGYDVVAQPSGRGLQRISVKTRTNAEKTSNFIGYRNSDIFDWLALVILPGEENQTRQIYILPREVADDRSYEAKHREGRGFKVNKLRDVLADYENNYALTTVPKLTTSNEGSICGRP